MTGPLGAVLSPLAFAAAVLLLGGLAVLLGRWVYAALCAGDSGSGDRRSTASFLTPSEPTSESFERRLRTRDRIRDQVDDDQWTREMAA